jgi:hypothetical protein
MICTTTLPLPDGVAVCRASIGILPLGITFAPGTLHTSARRCLHRFSLTICASGLHRPPAAPGRPLKDAALGARHFVANPRKALREASTVGGFVPRNPAQRAGPGPGLEPPTVTVRRLPHSTAATRRLCAGCEVPLLQGHWSMTQRQAQPVRYKRLQAPGPPAKAEPLQSIRK